MCGIFGYIGKKNNAAQIVFDGIKRLEYRGYDSWGIAIKVQSSLYVEKHVGKIGDAKVNLPESNLGIGHTRWATHGRVTVKNAHPHLDCTGRIALMHNGIIENFQELKEKLIKKGHHFVSETDTEVATHLIEDFLKNEGFTSSVRDAFNIFKGSNAIIAANSASNEIIAAKNGSPLIVGIGNNEFFIASDTSGIIKHTKRVIFLEDNQMVVLGNDLKLFSLPEGKEINPIIHTLTWDFKESEKGKYDHFLLKEIHEQPRVIETIAINHREEAQKLARLIKDAYGTFMLGCGTASYAALAGTYLFSRIAKVHVNFSIGSEFSYLEDYITAKTLVVPISQSGETMDVVVPVARAKRRGAKIAAIVNVLGSTLYRQADYKFLLDAGVENAVVSTKSYTAMLSLLLLAAYSLAGKQALGENLLQKAAQNIQLVLGANFLKSIKKLATELKRDLHMYIIGRGLAYPTALEASLKMKETSLVHAEGFAGGELKHGVIALIEKGTPTIVFAPNDDTYDDVISNAQEIKARGGMIIGIGPKNNQVFDRFLETADINEATMLPQVVIAQLLAYYLALAKGIKDPDKPRNLAKSVTVK